jgi:hypothetical protein
MSQAPAPVDQSTGSTTLALASLLVGIGCFIPGIGVIAAPIAILTGIIALRMPKGQAWRAAHRRMAIAGISLGGVALVVYLIVFLLFTLPPGTYRIF